MRGWRACNSTSDSTLMHLNGGERSNGEYNDAFSRCAALPHFIIGKSYAFSVAGFLDKCPLGEYVSAFSACICYACIAEITGALLKRESGMS